jgi:gliding motility-associated-like protein
MHIVKLLLISFLCLSFCAKGIAQLNVQTGEHYQSGLSFKQLHVCLSDKSVWAITANGKVYYKKESDPDFSIFLPTAAQIITGAAGFSANEMYFIVGGTRVIMIKNGSETPMTIPFVEVTRINDIAVAWLTDAIIDLQPAITKKSYIAIATNKYIYYAIQGTTAFDIQHNFVNKPLPNEPECRFTYKGYKTRDNFFTDPNGQCIATDHTIENVNGATYVSALPDRAPYPTKINATVFGRHFYNPFGTTPDNVKRYNIWGTDQGLYFRDYNDCPTPTIQNRLPNEVINDLEEVYALTTVFKQDYILAAANTGIFYTKNSIFPESGNQNNTFGNLERVADFPNLKVNELATETNLIGMYRQGQDWYQLLCERIVWATTEAGIYKVYLTLDQDYFNTINWTSMQYSLVPNNSDYVHPTFNLCDGQELTMNSSIPAIFSPQLVIKWFKDGVEIPGTIGQFKITVNEVGTYVSKIISLCEGIEMGSVPIVIQKNLAPEVTFSPPAAATICQGDVYPMETKLISGYTYRWYKDDVRITGATENKFSATATGSYRVEVSNCGANSSTSPSVQLTVQNLPSPVITVNQVNCTGQSVELTIDNPQALSIRWYFNAAPINFNDQRTITVQNEGKYTVSFSDGLCTSIPAVYDFKKSAPPHPIITKSSIKSLCNGETVTLSVNAIAGSTYLWSTGETGTSIIVNAAGNYTVQETTASLCKGVSEPVEVVVLDLPTLAVPAGEKICTIAGEKVILKAATGYATYTWDGILTTKETYTVSAPGNYVLEVADLNGCKASVTYQVTDYCKEVLMSNAFSPNGDGVNDEWSVSGLENDPKASITIFNRLGTKIYSTNGSKPSWNGRLNNGSAVPIGVYYYVILTKNSLQPIHGTITVIR